MMSDELDPRWSAQIEILVDQVQECLEGDATMTEVDVMPAVGQLREDGFGEREHGRPLWALIEDRVVDKYPEPAIHRRAELQSVIRTIQDAWESQDDLKTPSSNARRRMF